MTSTASPSKEELARIEQYLDADPTNPRPLVRAIAQAQMTRCAASAEFLAVASLVCLDDDDAAKAAELAAASLALGPRLLEALVVSGYAALARRDTAAAQGLFDEALRANARD